MLVREESTVKQFQRSSDRRLWPAALALALGAAVVLAACGSSGSKSTTSGTTTPTTGTSAAPTTVAPSTTFSTTSVAGLGTVVVDGAGRTVYILTTGDHTNGTCDDASGCTKAWPDLPLPDGVTSAKAGTAIDASLLGTKKLADGETYPTYNGWLLYEFSGDSGPGQGKGQGIHSFGGTWYALMANGNPVSGGGAAATSATTSAGSSGGGTPGY